MEAALADGDCESVIGGEGITLVYYGKDPKRRESQGRFTIALFMMALSGLFSGILAGFLGIGGGTVLVPILLAFGYTPIQAVATSSLAIAITALSGTIQNWRMGVLQPARVLAMGIPALLVAQGGVLLASGIPSRLLLIGFGCLMLLNIYLFKLRRRAVQQAILTKVDPPKIAETSTHQRSSLLVRGLTGSAAGLLAGLFGVGGGSIMVPLQILLLGDPLKQSIQTSLGVIVLTAIAAMVGHALQGNVIFEVGIALGLGGLIGAQVSTRFLPRLPEHWIAIAFRGLLFSLACYAFWRALMNG